MTVGRFTLALDDYYTRRACLAVLLLKGCMDLVSLCSHTNITATNMNMHTRMSRAMAMVRDLTTRTSDLAKHGLWISFSAACTTSWPDNKL